MARENDQRRRMAEDQEGDDTSSAASGNDNDDENPKDAAAAPQPPLPSFQETMEDLASWWCHAILKNEKRGLHVFDELSDALEFLAPIQEGSPMYLRLQCVVIWQELLKQTVPAPAAAESEDDDDSVVEDDSDTPPPPSPPPLEKRNFEAVLDKLLLLRKRYFSDDRSNLKEYQEVVRMISVHHELCQLYKHLDERKYTTQQMNASIDETLRKGRDEIYLGLSNIPQELADLVIKDNGWSFEQRRQQIAEFLLGTGDDENDEQSDFSVRWLQNRIQFVLLHWCEQCIPGGAPELVTKEYRGVGKLTLPTDDIEEAAESASPPPASNRPDQEQEKSKPPQPAAESEQAPGENARKQQGHEPVPPSQYISIRPKRKRREHDREEEQKASSAVGDGASDGASAASDFQRLPPTEMMRQKERRRAQQRGDDRSLMSSQSVNSRSTGGSSKRRKPWHSRKQLAGE